MSRASATGSPAAVLFPVCWKRCVGFSHLAAWPAHGRRGLSSSTPRKGNSADGASLFSARATGPRSAQALFPLLDKPFAFFGHSLGALVGFEVARELRRQYDVYPVRLFVSSGHAPQIPRRGLPIQALPEREFLEELHSLNGTPIELLAHRELMEIMLPILRADFALYEDYVYVPDFPLNCPIMAFGGLEDRKVSHRDLEAWRDQTSVAFSLRMFPGDHFFLNATASPLLQVLSRELQ